MYAVLIANLDHWFICTATDKTDAFNKALAVFGDKRVLSYCKQIS